MRAHSSSIAGLAVGSLVASLMLACGHAAAPAATTPAPAAASAPASNDGGTSGFPGVSWGDSLDQVRAHYPALDARGTLHQPFEGLIATIQFVDEGAGVRAVRIGIDARSADMNACGQVWQGLRTRLDARLGASQAENLAAYWTTSTAEVTASCNPDDSGAGELSISFTPPAE